MTVKNLKIVLFFSISFIYGKYSHAQDSAKQPNRINWHFQTTYVYQYKPSFRSPYKGVNSLIGKEEKQNSVTATLYAGAALWKGAELYINPEIAGGSGLSGALGMAGSSNGETYRVGNPAPTLYWARCFLTQTFALGREKEWQDDDANQLSGLKPKNYLRFSLGKFSLGDLFDNNDYSNSPRTQFLNWALINNGTWDYAANVRGYTYSFAAEVQLDNMAYKLAIATEPKEANGPNLNTNFKDSFALAYNVEIDRTIYINRKKGDIGFLLYLNDANMGSYTEALKRSGTPNVITTRELGRKKWGWGLNIGQELSANAGMFARVGWNDGKNETWAYTEIDRTFSMGLSYKGNAWKRKDDNAGIAIVLNGLSQEHKNYLTNGGSGFMLGDGALNYGTEAITECYYSLKPSATAPLWLTADYQFVINPGYNKDRGPVNIFSIRVHTEF
jgi:high affinity Mn2+ porin